MKKVLLVMLIGILLFAGCKGGGSAGIPVVGEWSTLGDESNGGTSIAEMEEIEKDGMPAYRFTGFVTEEYQYGYAEWSVTPDEDTLEALKKAKGISFKVQGDGQEYSIRYRVSDIKDWSHHEFRFEADQNGATIEAPINMFFQQPWGTSVGPLNEDLMANVFDIQWQTFEGWRPGPYDITIWDVRIMTK